MKKFNYLIAMAIAAFTFTSCEDVPEPFGQPINPNKEEIVIEPTGSGTEADPFNASAVLAKAKTLTADQTTDEEYYIKGYVTDPPSYTTFSYDISTSYNNATFGLADEKDGTPIFFIFRCKGLGGGDITNAEFIKKGDLVVIKGKLANYKGESPQTAQNAAYIVSINGDGDGGSGSGEGGGDTPTSKYGTAESPLTVAQAMALIDAESTIDEAFVKGKISQIDSYSSQYKSITYWISDDGGTTTQLEVYSGKGLDGADFAAKEDLTIGQTVTVKGKLKKYNDIYEFDKTSSIVSFGDGGGDTPTSKYGTAESPLTVAQAMALIDAESTIDEAFVKGKISQIDSYSSQYKSITYWISDDGGTTTQLEVYSGKGLDGADFAAKEDLTIGQTVTIKGKLKKYNDIYEFDKTSSIVSFGDGGGDTPTSKYGTADAPLTVAQAIALIDAESTIDEAFVKGKISQIDSYSSQYKSITYWISDDGGTTTQLEVYSGKGLNGADFAAKEDLTVGQTVTVKGKLKKYNAIYEFDKTSSIVSIQ